MREQHAIKVIDAPPHAAVPDEVIADLLEFLHNARGRLLPLELPELLSYASLELPGVVCDSDANPFPDCRDRSEPLCDMPRCWEITLDCQIDVHRSTSGSLTVTTVRNQLGARPAPLPNV